MATMLVSKGRFLVLSAGLLTIAVYLVMAFLWSQWLPAAQFSESRSEQPTIQESDGAIEVAEKSDLSDANLLQEGDVSTASPGIQSNRSEAVQVQVGIVENANGTISHPVATGTGAYKRPITGDASMGSISSPSNPPHNATDSDVPGTVSNELSATEDTSVESMVSPDNTLHKDTNLDAPGTVSSELSAAEDAAVGSMVIPGNPLDSTIDPDVPGIASIALAADFQSLLDSGFDVPTAIKYIDERVAEGKYGEEAIRN